MVSLGTDIYRIQFIILQKIAQLFKQQNIKKNNEKPPITSSLSMRRLSLASFQCTDPRNIRIVVLVPCEIDDRAYRAGPHTHRIRNLYFTDLDT